MEEDAVSPIEARKGMSLWVFLLIPHRAYALLGVTNLHFSLFWVMPPVQFMILRTLVWDGAPLERSPLGVYHLILAPLLSERIMMQVLMVMFMRWIERWIRIGYNVMLCRGVVCLSHSLSGVVILRSGHAMQDSGCECRKCCDCVLDTLLCYNTFVDQINAIRDDNDI